MGSVAKEFFMNILLMFYFPRGPEPRDFENRWVTRNLSFFGGESKHDMVSPCAGLAVSQSSSDGPFPNDAKFVLRF